jgi:hypothetical protein
MGVRTSDLHEWVDLSEVSTDAESYTVKDVCLIASGWSKNGRYYPPHVLEASVGLWDGVKAYADHAYEDRANRAPVRSVREIVGKYNNPRYQDGRVLADMKVIGEAQNWMWPMIPEGVIGLSINAVGQTVKGEADGQKGIVVEAIAHANSVDVVDNPAAGGGFENATLMMSDDGWTKAVLECMSIDELKEARPDLITTLKNEWKTPRDSKALASVKSQLKETEEKLKAVEQEKRALRELVDTSVYELMGIQKARKVDSLLAQHALPAVWADKLRHELLINDESAWAGIIENELAKASSVKRPVHVSGAGKPAGPDLARLRFTPNTGTGGVNVKLDEAAPRENETYNEWLRRNQND